MSDAPRASGRTWTTSPAPRVRIPAGVCDHEPARRRRPRRPGRQRPPAGRSTRTWRPMVAHASTYDVGSPPRGVPGRRLPLVVQRLGERASTSRAAAERSWSARPRQRPARSRSAPAARPRVERHVEPDAEHGGRPRRRARPARPACPASLRLVDQHVVRPLQRAGRRRRRAVRPRRPRARPAAAARATARPGPVGGAPAPRRSAPARGGVTQVRSSRPRPAVWCSATTTRPSAHRRGARSATTALVDGRPRAPRRRHDRARPQRAPASRGGRLGRRRHRHYIGATSRRGGHP